MQSSFFTNNRQRLVEQLQPNSLVVLTAFTGVQRDIDQPQTFQQEANFWYLCGINEPDWLLLIDTDNGQSYLVPPTLNHYQLVFNGGLTPEQATSISGVSKILTKAEDAKLIKHKNQIYTFKPKSRRIYGFSPNPAQARLQAKLAGKQITDVRPILAKMRAIKQPDEIAAIQEAVDITVDGIEAVYKELKKYNYEYQADAKLYYEFRNRGATHGFEPIVASGAKTCVLHSARSDDKLYDWLLMDVGARTKNYTADITRTIPLKSPTERQAKIYQAAQNMHDHFLGLLKPGASTEEVLKDAYTFVGEQMMGLGLIKTPALNQSGVFKFMPHSITHGLGIDTHDPLGGAEKFAEGMVLTDEVGVYLPEEGFGVRIENDVIITKNGAKNMSAKLPIALDALIKMIQ